MAHIPRLNEYLDPLKIDLDRVVELSERFLQTFGNLAAESKEQFLPTPISDSILRPVSKTGRGKNLAIDIGGTNLRVGFIELLSGETKRHLEQSWPIDDRLKNDNADGLFRWIGACIAVVVRQGCEQLDVPRDGPLSLGVTFSFPMEQHSLSQATFMLMGKGFAVASELDLGSRLLAGYEAGRDADLPPLRIAAIANDSVSTLVSFIYKYNETQDRRASMAFILGTGCNATIPLKLSLLHPSKRPQNITVLPGEGLSEDVRITLNTEWSIRGSAPPLRELGWISRWDEVLDSQNETPGFQPMEYMTAGRYLGELGRLMILDYLRNVVEVEETALPPGMLKRHGMTTTFLSHFKPLNRPALLKKLNEEFPCSEGFSWTEDIAEALYHIAKAIEVRAAGIVSAAVIALLTLAEEIPAGKSANGTAKEIGVGYTGGCIVHFQDYLHDCQEFLDQLVGRRYGAEPPLRVLLSPCHDGGMVGAGILVAAASDSRDATT